MARVIDLTKKSGVNALFLKKRRMINPLESLPYLLDQSIARWNDRLEHRLRVIELTFEEWRILLITARLGPMNIRQLSEATLVPHSTLGRWATQMERSGLVKRCVVPKDNRAVGISITPKGRKVFARALPIAIDEYNTIVRTFSDQELTTLNRLLWRLYQRIKE